jgi:hypothetical protein
MHDLFDVNSNGVLSLPDALAWLFFGTVGLLGLLVCAGLAIGSVVAVGQGAWAVLQSGGRLLSSRDAALRREPGSSGRSR